MDFFSVAKLGQVVEMYAGANSGNRLLKLRCAVCRRETKFFVMLAASYPVFERLVGIFQPGREVGSALAKVIGDAKRKENA